MSEEEENEGKGEPENKAKRAMRGGTHRKVGNEGEREEGEHVREGEKMWGRKEINEEKVRKTNVRDDKIL